MNKMYILSVTLLLFSCTKTEIKEVEVERIVTNTLTETVTVTNTIVIAPEEYSFTRNGVSTVYYTGQTSRLKMATELKSAMNNLSSNQVGIDNMFNQGKGFSDSSLDASGKKVGNKTAASPIASATVKPMFDAWITEFTTVVIPAVNDDITASSGVAGSYTEADGSRTVKVNAKGFELNQIFSKGLIGALQIDQIVNGYLSFSKLDGAKQDHDDDVYAYTFPGQTEPSITKMEHYWDEGFGYLQGLDNQFTSGLGDPSIGRDTANLNYYLNKVNKQANEAGITDRIYNAFSVGRAAIIAKDYDQRDRQAAIIASELSKVIGYKSQSYLRDAAEDIENGDWADALHALSEAYGFILGLQFTKTSDGSPYLSNQGVNELLNELSAGTGGFWERTPDELTAMADQLEQITGLTLE
ncbi:MAG: DUF4856 domain-containing protein [Flavobacteriaceae bacterium]